MIKRFCRKNDLLIHGTNLPGLKTIDPKTPGSWTGSQSEFVICATDSLAHAMKHGLNKSSAIPNHHILADFRVLGIPWLFYSITRSAIDSSKNEECYLYLLDKKGFTKRRMPFGLNLHSLWIVRNCHSEWTCSEKKSPVKMRRIKLSEVQKQPYCHDTGDRARKIILKNWFRKC